MTAVRPLSNYASMIAAAFCAALLVLPAAQAQTYPTKTIRLILPFAGGTDTVGRLVAGKMSEALGQQIVPDPRVGATGNIGFLAASKAPADGYTIVVGAVPVLTNPHVNPAVGYDFKDFAPISLLATIPNTIVVHPSVPVKNMRELISLARANPGKIAYGSGGFGSANHLASELLQLTTKIKFTHVPYRSATFGLAGSIAGEVDMVIVVISSALPFIKSGRMRPLVMLDTQRNPTVPDVPTSAETGLPGLIAVNWYGLLAPAGTPRAIMTKLNSEVVTVMKGPAMIDRLSKEGANPVGSSSAEFARHIQSEIAKWRKVVKAAGIEPR